MSFISYKVGAWNIYRDIYLAYRRDVTARAAAA